jgi:type II secretion system protein J
MKNSLPRKSILLDEKGFTLIEILVAASIMSVILVGLYMTFFSVTRARVRIDKTLERSREVRRFMDVMSTEARSSYFNAASSKTRFDGEFFERRGRSQSRVAFTWFSYPIATTASRPTSELMAVSYFIESTDGIDTLYKAKWNPYSDIESGYTAEVMEDVESFLLTYYTGKEWVKSWDALRETKLPKAIKIELALSVGEGMTKEYSTIVRTALGSI